MPTHGHLVATVWPRLHMSFAETHRYGQATAKRCHSPGTPLSWCAPRSSNSSPDPITRSRSVLDTSTSFGLARRTASRLPRSSNNRGDAVGPLLQSRQRARRDRIGGSRARLIEEDQPTERCHRLDPTLN
jgi:hypothetical protein